MEDPFKTIFTCLILPYIHFITTGCYCYTESLLAEAVGFEPTGLTPQQISSLRRYDHFGTPPYLYIYIQTFKIPIKLY